MAKLALSEKKKCQFNLFGKTSISGFAGTDVRQLRREYAQYNGTQKANRNEKTTERTD